MVSRENTVLVTAILVVVPAALLALSVLDGVTAVPQWAYAAAILLCGVVLPQLYLEFTGRRDDADPE
jgi:hypothetical protein